jgi:hypothetical protein
MTQYVGQSIIVFGPDGIGSHAAPWPWMDEYVAMLDADGARYAIVPDALPDAYWMDDAGEVHGRESVELTIDKSRIVAGGAEEAVVGGLPTHCTVCIGDEAQAVSDGELILSGGSAGLIAIRLTGPHRSNTLTLEAVDMAALRLAKKAQIDADAEACRNRVITPGSGQAMTYLRKAEAARAFLAGDMPDGPQKERITDEAARLGITPEEAAAAILAISDDWEVLDRLVDKVRLDTKKALEDAPGLDDIDAIMDAVTWPV